jgi:hypothetical protein
MASLSSNPNPNIASQERSQAALGGRPDRVDVLAALLAKLPIGSLPLLLAAVVSAGGALSRMALPEAQSLRTLRRHSPEAAALVAEQCLATYSETTGEAAPPAEALPNPKSTVKPILDLPFPQPAPARRASSFSRSCSLAPRAVRSGTSSCSTCVAHPQGSSSGSCSLSDRPCYQQPSPRPRRATPLGTAGLGWRSMQPPCL